MTLRASLISLLLLAACAGPEVGRGGSQAFDEAEIANEFPDLLPFLRRPTAADPCEGFVSDPECRVFAGDRFHVHVEGEPQLFEEVVVPDGGDVYFPFGKLTLAGRTLAHVAEEARIRLEQIGLRRPVVRCHRNWHILAPWGRVELHLLNGIEEIFFDRPSTLLSVLSTRMPAGTDWRRIVVVRKTEQVFFICDLWLYFAQAKVEQDLPLLHGDVIVLPRTAADWEQVRAILQR